MFSSMSRNASRKSHLSMDISRELARGINRHGTLLISSVADPDPGSGAFLTPGSGMGKKSGSGMSNPDHFREF